MAHKYCENPLSCDICMNHLEGVKYSQLISREAYDTARAGLTLVPDSGKVVLKAHGQFIEFNLPELVVLRQEVEAVYHRIFDAREDEIADLMAADPNKQTQGAE